MRIYICCHHSDPANELAAVLEAAGHQIVSSWHSDGQPRPADGDAIVWRKKAELNLQQIDLAEAVVVISSLEHVSREKCVPGGKFVEAGYALNHALGSGGPSVIIFGGVENGMLYHPAVLHTANVKELIRLLEGL